MFNEILIDKSTDSSWHSYENSITIDLHYDIINAEIIVGQHGANLTNIILANQNCKIIEIFNDDHIYEYYMSLSHAIDNKYYTGIIYTDKDNLISNIRKITNE